MSGPKEQRQWDAESEDVRQAFKVKDAEIARLYQVIESERQAALDGKEWMRKAQEASRAIDRKNALITELASALRNCKKSGWQFRSDFSGAALDQRAKEETK
jgi:hypothetical protein